MPIPRDPEQRYSKLIEPSYDMRTNTSEENVSIDFHDGPLPGFSSWDTAEIEGVGPKENEPKSNGGGVCTSDRNELMERIKRGESPTWVPSQTLQEEYFKQNDQRPHSPLSISAHRDTLPLLPVAHIERKSSRDNDGYAAELSPPSEIKRPRSALHAGDFNRGSQDAAIASQQARIDKPTTSNAQSISGISVTTPWSPPSPGAQILPISQKSLSSSPASTPLRSRAPSLHSHSSSFVAKAPTTPLIQQSNNTDLDFSPIDTSISPTKTNRRHTLPPRPSHTGNLYSDSPGLGSATPARQSQPVHRDSTIPIHTHRPRRSLTTSWSLQASPSSQRPTILHSRRQSQSSEASPLQNASMVGSYEESILRGWMSTAPSKPLDFTAQIGVLGKANYKPKCPAHVTVPFPAVFYSWSQGAGRKHSDVDDEPSPYVGHIDLQHLSTPAELRKTRRSRSKSPSGSVNSSKRTRTDGTTGNTSDSEHASKSQRKRRRTSPTPSSLQGGYRIPQKGQLQIVIKNPNKTAVKLFLVPYDLEDMQPGTKTFIRQRCYSTDPVIDGLPTKCTSEPTLTTSRSTASKKPTLRYLIHVNICSPSNGRFYLYQHIRIVFANRVPDNKEQLQTEIQVPQPRYSTYNPNFALSRSLSSSSTTLAREKAYRRRSAGFGVGHGGLDDRHPCAWGSGISYPSMFDSPDPPPVPGIPFHLANSRVGSVQVLPPRMEFPYDIGTAHSTSNRRNPPFPTCGDTPVSPTPVSPFQPWLVRGQGPTIDYPCNNDRSLEDGGAMEIDDSTYQYPQSPLNDKTNRGILQSKSSNLSRGKGGEEGNGTYSKLHKGDAGYGGGRSSTPEPGEGLLARKLKGLGVQIEFDAREKGW